MSWKALEMTRKASEIRGETSQVFGPEPSSIRVLDKKRKTREFEPSSSSENGQNFVESSRVRVEFALKKNRVYRVRVESEPSLINKYKFWRTIFC